MLHDSHGAKALGCQLEAVCCVTASALGTRHRGWHTGNLYDLMLHGYHGVKAVVRQQSGFTIPRFPSQMTADFLGILNNILVWLIVKTIHNAYAFIFGSVRSPARRTAWDMSQTGQRGAEIAVANPLRQMYSPQKNRRINFPRDKWTDAMKMNFD